MTQELIYTSAEKGLRLGSRGFCTVASSAGMAKPLADRLEALSGYRHLHPPGSANAHLNPINFSYLTFKFSGSNYYVLSRIADAGLDHTQRSNKLAHHIVLASSDLVSAGPAWIASQGGFFTTKWHAEPQIIAQSHPIPQGDLKPTVCRAWQAATGDAGWGGVLAESAVTGKEAYVIYPSGTNVLQLVLEAQSLLTTSQRWAATFSTYYMKLPPGVECRWRFVPEGTPEAQLARRSPGQLVIDLCSKLNTALAGPLIQMARTGKSSLPPAPPLSTTSVAVMPPVYVSTPVEPVEYATTYSIDAGVTLPPTLPPRTRGTFRDGNLPVVNKGKRRISWITGFVATLIFAVVGVGSYLVFIRGFSIETSTAVANKEAVSSDDNNEAAAKLAAEQEAAVKLAAEQEAAVKLAAEQEAAAKLAVEQEATAKLAAEQEAAVKLAAEQEAAAKLAVEQEAATSAEWAVDRVEPIGPWPGDNAPQRMREFSLGKFPGTFLVSFEGLKPTEKKLSGASYNSTIDWNQKTSYQWSISASGRPFATVSKSKSDSPDATGKLIFAEKTLQTRWNELRGSVLVIKSLNNIDEGRRAFISFIASETYAPAFLASNKEGFHRENLTSSEEGLIVPFHQSLEIESKVISTYPASEVKGFDVPMLRLVENAEQEIALTKFGPSQRFMFELKVTRDRYTGNCKIYSRLSAITDRGADQTLDNFVQDLATGRKRGLAKYLDELTPRIRKLFVSFLGMNDLLTEDGKLSEKIHKLPFKDIDRIEKALTDSETLTKLKIPLEVPGYSGSSDSYFGTLEELKKAVDHLYVDLNAFRVVKIADGKDSIRIKALNSTGTEPQ